MLDRVDFTQVTRRQNFDASMDPSERIDYSHVEIRGTSFTENLVGGSGNNTIIANSHDFITGGDGYDFYQVDLTAANIDEFGYHSVGINNFATDGLLDTVYLDNINYEEILPGVLFGDLYLAQVSDSGQRSAFNNTLSTYVVSPFLEGSFSPSIRSELFAGQREMPIVMCSLSPLMVSPLRWMQLVKAVTRSLEMTLF